MLDNRDYGYHYDYYSPAGPSHAPVSVPFSFGLTQTAPQGPTAAGLIGSITDGGSGGRGLANFAVVDTKGILEAAFPHIRSTKDVLSSRCIRSIMA